jgi:Interferon-induced transmembrane protein
MAAASIVPMDDLPQEKPSEDIVEQPPPSYQLLFSTPNTSENVQCQPKSIVLTVNGQCRQPFVSAQSISGQPIYCIKSHITWSILNIIFCCCLCGCVACCFSMKTKNLKKQGDTQGALKASKTAKTWNTISTIAGIILITINIIRVVTASYTYSG